MFCAGLLSIPTAKFTGRFKASQLSSCCSLKQEEARAMSDIFGKSGFAKMLNYVYNRQKRVTKAIFTLRFIYLLGIFCIFPLPAFAQTYTTQFAPGQQQPQNYLKNSAAFRQEIMRMEINVVRGNQSLPITQIPRVQKDDVIKMKLLDEAVGGIKPDQSMWDWTFMVAYVNPNRRADVKEGNNQSAVSQEIQFRKSGWYKEYSFKVPYDSQPVFFLYPKPKYREKILKVVSRNYEEVRKLGEKTIEIAGAYAQISSFLNELQMVLYQTQSSRYANNSTYNSGYYYSYNPYNPYNPYGNKNKKPDIPFNYNAFVEQSIERIARSFNIALPNCWQQGGGGYNSYGTGSYNTYGNTYGSYGSYGSGNQNNFGYAVSTDLINRAQCVAKNIRLEDFDFSVSQLLKQGGIMLATQLRDKFPQLAYWINLAAVAIDFIVKVFQKSPLKLVPTIVQSSDNNAAGSYSAGGSYQNNYSTNYSSSSSNSLNPSSQMQPVKISLYAESQPDANGFVTAYPIVVHKWQAEPDPEVISLYPPVLAEPCLHVGTNLLKNTDLSEAWSDDRFARDFKLVVSSSNGFKKELPLKKNKGLGGWELTITPEDMNQIPKINMTLESEIVGTRGFNEIRSPKFDLPLPLGGSYEITSESQKAFSVGGKRTVTLRNNLGSCRCLQRVVYKPSFGGQFVFEANSGERGLQFSADGREVSFEVDTSHFQPGAGQLEIKSYGDQQQQVNQQASVLNLKLYPLPPNISNVKISKGDSYAIVSGDRLEQVQSVRINGKRAIAIGNQTGQQSYANPGAVNQPYGSSQNLSQSGNQATNPTTPQLSSNASLSIINSLSLPAVSPNEKLFVFEDSNARQTDNTVSIELGLEDNRTFQYPKTFTAAPARPAIVVNENKEIEAFSINETLNAKNQNSSPNSILAPVRSMIFPVETSAISVKVQNALTDYDFKIENISIETRIERSQTTAGYGSNIELPRTSLEVLDWKNLKISFSISEQTKKMLGGRRLQFRIRDRERGDSDWYSIKQTFVRVPEIESVRCTKEMNGMCEMKGSGIDYISQVSTDAGASWYPRESSSTLQTQQSTDGKQTALIPFYADKKLLVIRLRDFPKEAILITSYVFSSTGRAAIGKRAEVNNSAQPNNPLRQ